MEGLFVYFALLIILVIALLKQNLTQKEKILDFKMDIEELNSNHNSVCKDFNKLESENKKLKDLLEIQNGLIDELEKK